MWDRQAERQWTPGLYLLLNQPCHWTTFTPWLLLCWQHQTPQAKHQIDVSKNLIAFAILIWFAATVTLSLERKSITEDENLFRYAGSRRSGNMHLCQHPSCGAITTQEVVIDKSSWQIEIVQCPVWCDFAHTHFWIWLAWLMLVLHIPSTWSSSTVAPTKTCNTTS